MSTKPQLSDVELLDLDDQLYKEMTGSSEPDSLHMRDQVTGHDCFPADGYAGWKHRWFLGTDVWPSRT